MKKIVLLSLLLSTASIFMLSNLTDSATYVAYPYYNFTKVVAIDGNDNIGKERNEEQPKQTVSESQKPKEELPSRSNGHRKLTVLATAYTAMCKEGCIGITATGLDVRYKTPKIVAVDPLVIPLHSKVIIDGQEYLAEDTGGKIKGEHIDILVKTEKEAKNFGKKMKQIEIYQ